MSDEKAEEKKKESTKVEPTKVDKKVAQIKMLFQIYLKKYNPGANKYHAAYVESKYRRESKTADEWAALLEGVK